MHLKERPHNIRRRIRRRLNAIVRIIKVQLSKFLEIPLGACKAYISPTISTILSTKRFLCCDTKSILYATEERRVVESEADGEQ